jgi:hypothetical protein
MSIGAMPSITPLIPPIVKVTMNPSANSIEVNRGDLAVEQRRHPGEDLDPGRHPDQQRGIIIGTRTS